MTDPGDYSKRNLVPRAFARDCYRYICILAIRLELACNGEKQKQKQVTYSNTNPRSGHYLTHAHSHITQAVAAMDSYFGLLWPHQHGIAVRYGCAHA